MRFTLMPAHCAIFPILLSRMLSSMFSAVQALLTGTNRHQQTPTDTNRHQQTPTDTNRHQQAVMRLSVAYNADNGSNGSQTMVSHVAAFNHAQVTTALTRTNHSTSRFCQAVLRALIPRNVSCQTQRDSQICLKVAGALKVDA